MPSDIPSGRDLLRQALAPGKDCPPIERLGLCLEGEAAPLDLARHLQSCSYCRTEIELLRSFHAPPRDAAEAEAIRMVTERLRSPRPPVPDAEGWWKGLFQVRWLRPATLAMAGVLIAIAIGLQWQHGGAPRIYAPNSPEKDVLRSGSLSVIAPAGDLREVPKGIEWQPVVGAARYEVRLLEVDHTEFWKSSTPGARLDLPAEVQARIVPAKTLLLQVTAFDSLDHKLAESELDRFRLLQNIYSR